MSDERTKRREHIERVYFSEGGSEYSILRAQGFNRPFLRRNKELFPRFIYTHRDVSEVISELRSMRRRDILSSLDCSVDNESESGSFFYYDGRKVFWSKIQSYIDRKYPPNNIEQCDTRPYLFVSKDKTRT
jgi:hypothetical protein